MSATLALTVVVRHPETGAATALVAGQPLPDWAEGLVHPDDLIQAEQEQAPIKPARRKR